MQDVFNVGEKMNAELAKKSSVDSQVLLKGLNEFYDKSVNKKITKDDGANFATLISSFTHSAKSSDRNISDNLDAIVDCTNRIENFLKSKENTEHMTKIMELPQVKTSLDNLARYCDEVQKKAKSVKRKDPNNMPKSR